MKSTKPSPTILTISCSILIWAQVAVAQSDRKSELMAAIDQLSASTAPEGRGADAYAELLHSGLSRWTVGSDKIVEKEEWVEGIRGWFTDGWRVSDRQSEIVELSFRHDLAFLRRVVTETYLGPEGDTSSSKAALSETWVSNEGKWLLFRVEVAVIPD